MVMVGVAIAGVLSPPGIGHPGDGADAQPLRSGIAPKLRSAWEDSLTGLRAATPCAAG
jgi:hypothetical protein